LRSGLSQVDFALRPQCNNTSGIRPVETSEMSAKTPAAALVVPPWRNKNSSKTRLLQLRFQLELSRDPTM
jgi:hypothetical protein